MGHDMIPDPCVVRDRLAENQREARALRKLYRLSMDLAAGRQTGHRRPAEDDRSSNHATRFAANARS